MGKLTNIQLQQIQDDYAKANLVIDSCKNKEHIKGAFRYINLFYKKSLDILPTGATLEFMKEESMIIRLNNKLIFKTKDKKEELKNK